MGNKLHFTNSAPWREKLAAEHAKDLIGVVQAQRATPHPEGELYSGCAQEGYSPAARACAVSVIGEVASPGSSNSAGATQSTQTSL